MNQQSANPTRVAVEDIALFVWTYVHTVYKNLTVLYLAPAVFKVYPAAADGFNLGADKLDSCLQRLYNEIFMPSLTVFGDGFI